MTPPPPTLLKNGPRLLPRRPGSPEPQEFCPHPTPPPWSRRPLAAPGRLSPGIPAPQTPGSTTLPHVPAVVPACRPGPCALGSPGDCSASSACSRFRQAVEAAPPEAAAAGAGESRSRSQRAGASAPFPGCDVIHPTRPGDTQRSAHLDPGQPRRAPSGPGDRTCHTTPPRVSLLSSGPFTSFTYLAHPLPIRRKRDQRAANQEAATAASLARSPSATGA